MLTIIQGDALTELRKLPAESVHCCVTSPPYWGLRDYGSCDCGSGRFDLGQGEGTGGNLNYRPAQGFKSNCPKCQGSGRVIGMNSQLGLEKTPEEYVAKMVEVFREVRRVLRKDGTLWLNLGDSYVGANNTNQGGNANFGSQPGRTFDQSAKASWTGLPSKNLIGIPWRVAFALQADGWWLRSDIIWAKPNPMPESVTDRPTKAHEYLFLLTKRANYFYDAEAIKERSLPQSIERLKYPVNVMGGPNGEYGARIGQGGERTMVEAEANRNKRSVWTVATAPYPEAHFATYPPDLIKPCILAGTSAKGCCAKCGNPWERIIESKPMVINRSDRTHELGRTRSSGTMLEPAESKTIGWQPTCVCLTHDEKQFALHPSATKAWWGSEPNLIYPCTVLDPFAGSGTTGAVALDFGRKAILIELNPKYVELIRQRCDVTPGLALA